MSTGFGFGSNVSVQEFPDRESWLLRRRSGIGSSDAPIIVADVVVKAGQRVFQSPLALFAEKIGATDTKEETDYMKAGRHFEQGVADWYAEETKRELMDLGRHTIITNAAYPWAFASLDRLILSKIAAPTPEEPTRGLGVLEIKTTSEFLKDMWAEEPPLGPQIQLQHQLAVTGLGWGSIAAVIGGNKLVWQDQVRNQDFIDGLMAREEDFYRRLVDNDPPTAEVAPSESTLKALKSLYPEDTGETVPLPEEAVEWLDAWEKAKADAKAAEKIEKEQEARLKAAIGANTFGTLPNGVMLSLKTTNRGEYVVAATSFRTLRRMK